jgi:hypothetical protein
MTVPDSRSYISTITDVREVALAGTANLAYWRDLLRPEALVPFEDDGRASLLLTAIESKFRGIAFRELSISVLVSDDGGATAAGAFLAHAYNSSRLLALAERAFFQTPYHLARLTVDERLPARIGVARNGVERFEARMGLERPPARREDLVFNGPIYLPGGRKVFFARLSGMAGVFPFDVTDTLNINSGSSEPIFHRLLESGFAGKEWLVRSGAVHARTKTYRRENRKDNYSGT